MVTFSSVCFSSNYSRSVIQSLAFMFALCFLSAHLLLENNFCVVKLILCGRLWISTRVINILQCSNITAATGHMCTRMWRMHKDRKTHTAHLQILHTLCIFFCSFVHWVYSCLPVCQKLYDCVCVCVHVCESYQLGEKHSVFDGTPRSSLIFPIDFLLLSFLRSQGMGCLNWSRPV